MAMFDDYMNAPFNTGDPREKLAMSMRRRRAPLQFGATQPSEAEMAIAQNNLVQNEQGLSDSKTKLAQSLGKQYENMPAARSKMDVLAHGLMGGIKGFTEVQAQEEEKLARQKLAEALSSGSPDLAQIAQIPGVKLDDITSIFKAQQFNPYSPSNITGAFARIQSGQGTPEDEQAIKAYQARVNAAAVAGGTATPMNFGPTPQRPAAQPSMVPPPAPPGDMLAGDLPDIPENGMVPTPTAVPTGAPQPPMSGVPFLDKINLQTWADATKEKSKKDVELQSKRAEAEPKSFASLDSHIANTQRLNEMIDNDILPNVGAMTSGFVGATTSGIPGTPAHNLAANLDTIKANIGFDRLQQMRAESPTGGALGQVAVQELQFLQRSMRNVEQSQSEAQLKKNLNALKADKAASDARIKAAYEREYGKKFQPTKIDKAPPMEGAKQAPDGKYYIPDPNRPGKYLQVVQ